MGAATKDEVAVGGLLSNGAIKYGTASAKSQLFTSTVGFQTAGMSKSIAVSTEQLRAAEHLLMIAMVLKVLKEP